MADSDGMQLISRAAAILRALEGRGGGLSLGRIATETGLPRPTVQRIVDALRREGFVARDPAQGGVLLGPALVRMAASIRSDLGGFARPALERLAARLNETVALTVLSEGRAVVLALVSPPDREIALAAQPGSAWPLHSTAEGKALLAGLEPTRIAALLPDPLPQRTPHTQTRLPELLAEIEAVACQGGVAQDLEGTAEGLCALAAGLTDPSGRRYAISVIVAASRFPPLRATLKQALLDCRAEVAAAAGLA